MPEFLNKIICGDCIEVLGKVSEPFADLIFADPPFNIGYKYDKYHDEVASDKYIDWTRQWMTACKKVLKPYGSFYIAIGDDYAANVKVIAEKIGLVMRNWIIWHYTFGQQTKDKFARAHTHIFYFVNDAKKFTFNDYAVRVPSDRQLIYDDKRANPAGKMPDDVWEDSRVCGTFKERTGWHPCQMPESVLMRIIAISSKPGDCVLDPFVGSGTTAVAARKLQRDYVGIEISAEYAKKAEERLAKLDTRCSILDTRKSSKKTAELNPIEIIELKRLIPDMGCSPKQVLSDKGLLELFTSQFTIRMNSQKQYSATGIATALRDLANR
jgi:site-specific DNA-methyltransferase (adenine-specific)